MNKTRNIITYVAVVLCILVIGLMLGWDRSSQAQLAKDPAMAKEKGDVERLAVLGQTEGDEISTIDISKFGPFDVAGYKSPPTILGVPGVDQGEESEPNDTPATANPLSGSQARIQGDIFPNGDIDYFSFTAQAGSRVYAAVQTSFSASGSADSQLRIIGTDGATVLEFDEDDGSFGGFSSSIAGVTIPSNGTYYVRVNHFSATNSLRPYYLYLTVRSGSPTAETEPNNTTNGGQPAPASGWISGAVTPAADNDAFLFSLNAGDSVFLSLDLDPERDGGTSWNGRLGLATFGTPGSILVVNDPSTTSPNSEAFFFTVKDAGTYFAYVDDPGGTGLANFTYNLNIMVVPAESNAGCTTYTSTDVPKTIPDGPGIVSSTLTIPGSPKIDKLRVFVNLNHANMPDLDVTLRSPANNDNGLFTDIGSSTQQGMDLWLDDEAALPIGLFTVNSGMRYQPESVYRLDWFENENAGGTWTLDIRDDLAANGGTLNGWGIQICEDTSPGAAPGGTTETLFFQDFEGGEGGFTHSGTQDEWQHGTPNLPASAGLAEFIGCYSGTKCWKTDLTGGYNASSSQDLDSPPINIPAGSTNVMLSWAMRYSIESASFDNAWIEIRPVGNPAGNTIIGRWTGPTMNHLIGNPSVSVGESAGWAVTTGDITSFAGQQIVVRFHLDSDSSVNLAGWAIDDFKITRAASAAAPSTVSGRLLTPAGRGVNGSWVTLTEQNGTKHVAITNSFGFFVFFNILSQQNVTVSATSKRYTFSDSSFMLSGNSFVGMTGTPNF